MKWHLTPLEDFVIVKRFAPEEKTVGGILLPSKYQDDKTHLCEVLEVGPGRTTESGVRVPMVVQKGQVVLIGKYVGSHITPPGSYEPQWLAVREDDIISIVQVETEPQDAGVNEHDALMAAVGGLV